MSAKAESQGIMGLTGICSKQTNFANKDFATAQDYFIDMEQAKEKKNTCQTSK